MSRVKSMARPVAARRSEPVPQPFAADITAKGRREVASADTLIMERSAALRFRRRTRSCRRSAVLQRRELSLPLMNLTLQVSAPGGELGMLERHGFK